MCKIETLSLQLVCLAGTAPGCNLREVRQQRTDAPASSASSSAASSSDKCSWHSGDARTILRFLRFLGMDHGECLRTPPNPGRPHAGDSSKTIPDEGPPMPRLLPAMPVEPSRPQLQRGLHRKAVPGLLTLVHAIYTCNAAVSELARSIRAL